MQKPHSQKTTMNQAVPLRIPWISPPVRLSVRDSSSSKAQRTCAVWPEQWMIKSPFVHCNSPPRMMYSDKWCVVTITVKQFLVTFASGGDGNDRSSWNTLDREGQRFVSDVWRYFSIWWSRDLTKVNCRLTKSLDLDHPSPQLSPRAKQQSTVSSLPARMAPARGSLNMMTCAMKDEHLSCDTMLQRNARRALWHRYLRCLLLSIWITVLMPGQN